MWSKVTAVFNSSALFVEDVSPRFGLLWEPNDNSKACRACGILFQAPITTRHHCRNCTLCFCDACVPPRGGNANSITRAAKEFIDDKSSESIRICDACYRGECTGRSLQTKVLQSLQNSSGASTLRKGSSSASQREPDGPLILNLLETEVGAPKRFEFTRGEISNFDNPEQAPPTSGHFEFKNKTSSVCAVKLQVSRSDKNWALVETARPSFTAVAPGESLHCTFDSREGKESDLDLIVLYGNPNPFQPGTRLVIYTRTNPDAVSPCASIPAFSAASAFKISAVSKNAILKLREDNGAVALFPRVGNSVERIGWVQRFIFGKKTLGNKIDLETNTILIKPVFSLV
jgi:hypothetical protein